LTVASTRTHGIFGSRSLQREDVMANKEQKRSNREAKKPKQKKKGSEKRPISKGQTAKT
jgi:hypothetical protein